MILLVVLAGVATFGVREPSHEGKTVTEWLDGLGASMDGFGRIVDAPAYLETLGAIRAMGANSLPVLLRHLDGPPVQSRAVEMWAQIRESLGWFGEKLPGSRIGADSEAHQIGIRRQYAATTALLALGAIDGTGALRILARRETHALSDSWPVIEAMCAELPANAKLRETIVVSLRDPAPGIRRQAVAVAAFSGHHLAFAFSSVTNLLSDPDSEVSQYAVFATRATGRDQPELARCVLAEVLARSPNPAQRIAAATAIADFGTNARPALEAATRDPDAFVARKARGSLKRVLELAGRPADSPPDERSDPVDSK